MKSLHFTRTVFLLAISLISCSEDEPIDAGTYRVSEIEYHRPTDPALFTSQFSPD